MSGPEPAPAGSRRVTLEVTGLAHGGAGIGRDNAGRVIFVPGGLPGERVTVAITQDEGRYAQSRLVAIDVPAPDRITPRCRHFGVCGGCHLQHVPYERQLAHKDAILRNQWERAGLPTAVLQPIWASPSPWAYRSSVTFSPAGAGSLGFWAPAEGRVIPIDRCEVIRPALQSLHEDIDLDLQSLRQISLHQGDDEALLIALEVQGVTPPSLNADFPVSVVMVLPDRTTANLIGNNHTVRTIHDRDFRVTAGVPFPPSSQAATQIVDACLTLGKWSSAMRVLEGGVGTGLLTAFIAPHVAAVIGAEPNPDAVADAAINLDDTDNVALYESNLPAVLAAQKEGPDLILLTTPARGNARQTVAAIAGSGVGQILISSHQLAMLVRDGKRLLAAGYQPAAVQPIDTQPHHFDIHTVSRWEKR